jgi:hypothetical protein
MKQISSVPVISSILRFNQAVYELWPCGVKVKENLRKKSYRYIFLTLHFQGFSEMKIPSKKKMKKGANVP